MDTNRIPQRKCQHCGRSDYFGVLARHIAARHPQFATPMVPWSARVRKATGR